MTRGAKHLVDALAEAFTLERIGAFKAALEGATRRPIRAGEFDTRDDVYLRDAWAEALVQAAAFRHALGSPGCRLHDV